MPWYGAFPDGDHRFSERLVLQHRAVAVSVAVVNTVWSQAIAVSNTIAVPKSVAISGDVGDFGHCWNSMDSVDGWSGVGGVPSDGGSHRMLCPVRVSLGDVSDGGVMSGGGDCGSHNVRGGVNLAVRWNRMDGGHWCCVYSVRCRNTVAVGPGKTPEGTTDQGDTNAGAESNHCSNTLVLQ